MDTDGYGISTSGTKSAAAKSENILVMFRSWYRVFDHNHILTILPFGWWFQHVSDLKVTSEKRNPLATAIHELIKPVIQGGVFQL
jgi:hypothetical protein